MSKEEDSPSAFVPPPVNLPPAACGEQFSQLLSGSISLQSESPHGGLELAMSFPAETVSVPLVAVPCFLAPASILETPVFSGQFAMSHQAVLASVTAQAQIQLQAAYPSQSEALDSNISTPMLTLPSFDRKSQSIQIGVKTSSSDGYSWRKYGQKQVKSSDITRSYYRCTNGNCMAKKKVERCPNGREIEIIFRGKHNHDPPQKFKYPKEKGIREPCNENETLDTQSGEVNESDLSSSKVEHISGNEASEQDCEGDAAIKTAEGKDNEPVPKRRLVESHPPYSAPVLKTIKEPKIVVRSASDPASTSDGYRWRKYGQKLVKGNPNPRSYYRCTNNGCPVRKHVEKSSDDSKSILITYEGKHNHNRPTLKSNDVNLVGDKESMESAETLLSIGTNSSLFSENCAAVHVHNS